MTALTGTSPSQIEPPKPIPSLCEISNGMTCKAVSLPQFHRRQRSGQNDCSSPENCDHESPIACKEDHTGGRGGGAKGCDVMDLRLQEPSKRVKAKPRAQSESSVAGGWTARGPRNKQGCPQSPGGLQQHPHTPKRGKKRNQKMSKGLTRCDEELK